MFIIRVVVVDADNERRANFRKFLFEDARYFRAPRARVMGNAGETRECRMREDATVTLPGFANASNRALASRIEVRETALQTHRGLTEDGVVFVFAQ